MLITRITDITMTLFIVLVAIFPTKALGALAAVVDVAALSQQAASGQVEAMLALAEYYSAGDQKTPDPATAFSWYLQAAKRGNAKAQTEVGVMLELGRGTSQNYKEATVWYRKAADQGYARAQTDLGFLYETGNGLMLDYRQALALYQSAAVQGYARAQVMLGTMYEKGRGVPQDSAQAISWYTAAARQGYSRGQLALGRLYETGSTGVAADLKAALSWYEKAARQGNRSAKERLQVMHMQTGGGADRPVPSPSFNSEQTAKPPMTWQPPAISSRGINILAEMARHEIRQLQSSRQEEGQQENFLLADVMQMECSDVNLPYLESKILAAQSSAAEGDLGLRFDSGYRMRDTIDTNDSQRQHAYAGLSWDLLKDGLHANQSASRRLDCQRQISELRAEQDRHRDLFTCRDTYLLQRFNVWKHAIQKRRAEVLQNYFELTRRDYFLGYQSADKLFKIELEMRKTLEGIEKFEFQGAEVIDQDQFDDQTLPPFVELNLAELNKTIDEDPAYSKIAELSETILTEKYDPLHDKRLRLYAESDVMKDTELGSGGFMGGVTFSTPIFRTTPDILPLELQRARAAIAKEKETLRTELTRLHNSYGEKLVDAIKMVYRQRIVGERLRQALLRLEPKNRRPEQAPDLVKDQMQVIELLQELLDVRFELIAVQEGLYRHLLHTFTVAQTGWRQEFTQLAALDFDLKRGRTGQRAIYIWSEAFGQTDNTFLVQALEAKAVTTIVLSAAKSVIQGQKFADFLKLTTLHQIKIELILSDNSWIEPEKWPKAEERIKELLAVSHTLHLDIEPHTLPDYKAKKETYNKAFLELIGKIRALTGDKTGLAISLPTLYDQEFVNAIGAQVDRIYVMAYGKAAQQSMDKKLRPFANIPSDKLVLALRPDDFSSELELERFIDQTSQGLGIRAFAFHDLPQFFRLGQQDML